MCEVCMQRQSSHFANDPALASQKTMDNENSEKNSSIVFLCCPRLSPRLSPIARYSHTSGCIALLNTRYTGC